MDGFLGGSRFPSFKKRAWRIDRLGSPKPSPHVACTSGPDTQSSPQKILIVHNDVDSSGPKSDSFGTPIVAIVTSPNFWVVKKSIPKFCLPHSEGNPCHSMSISVSDGDPRAAPGNTPLEHAARRRVPRTWCLGIRNPQFCCEVIIFYNT